jgi:hypothetical protein
MSNSSVTCDGSGLFAEFSGAVPKHWDTGIQIYVPPDQFCWFLPVKTGKWKQVLLRPSKDVQPLVLRSKQMLSRVKKGKMFGTLHFLKSIEVEKSVKLEWKEE